MKSKVILLALCTVLLSAINVAQAQLTANKYWIQFTNKDNNGFSTSQPEQFLSARAIERRLRYNIEVSNRDLPVTESYVSAVRSVGASVLYRSKWLNGVVIYLGDTTLLSTINQLPFVASSRKLARVKQKNTAEELKEQMELMMEMMMEQSGEKSSKTPKNKTSNDEIQDYGLGRNQIDLINGRALHKAGRLGQGIQIAVFDAGFPQVDTSSFFTRLRDENRILGTYDVVNGTNNVFGANSHGRAVLSTMAAWKEGLLVGTAPKASYLLVRTEDAATEYQIEEYNWVRGAEWADSSGADIINSSLGYTTFDDPSQNHTYEQLDGNTTVITRGADWAAATGMLVVNSAGNSGDSQWKFIGAPADADSILTVGAVDSLGVYASFSSRGPSADGRMKPNVTAMGKQTAYATGFGSVFRGNGTSFSGPIIAGMAACLWQEHLDKTAYQIIKAIEQSADRASNPDFLHGFGIPDFGKADFILRNLPPIAEMQDSLVNVYPNPVLNGVTVEFFSTKEQKATLEITSLNGKRVYFQQVELKPFFNNYFNIQELKQVKQGIYVVTLTIDKRKYSRKIVKG